MPSLPSVVWAPAPPVWDGEVLESACYMISCHSATPRPTGSMAWPLGRGPPPPTPPSSSDSRLLGAGTPGRCGADDVARACDGRRGALIHSANSHPLATRQPHLHGFLDLAPGPLPAAAQVPAAVVLEAGPAPWYLRRQVELRGAGSYGRGLEVLWSPSWMVEMPEFTVGAAAGVARPGPTSTSVCFQSSRSLMVAAGFRARRLDQLIRPGHLVGTTPGVRRIAADRAVRPATGRTARPTGTAPSSFGGARTRPPARPAASGSCRRRAWSRSPTGDLRHGKPRPIRAATAVKLDHPGHDLGVQAHRRVTAHCGAAPHSEGSPEWTLATVSFCCAARSY